MKINQLHGKTFFPLEKGNSNNPSGDEGWQEENNKLHRKFEFKDFSEAFAFMTRVAMESEKMDHHPRWTNVWNSVEIWLSTHDAGDVVTEKDRKLAKRIDSIL